MNEAFEYTTSHGQRYFLNKLHIIWGGKPKVCYYFSKDIRETAINQLPTGYEVTEHPKAGFPLLKKIK